MERMWVVIVALVALGCSSKGGNGGPVPTTIPQITSAPSTVATLGMPYSYILTVIDSDDSTHNYSLSGAPTGMFLLGSTLNWTPQVGQSDSGLVTVTVSDADGNSDSQSFRILVADPVGPPMVDLAGGSFTQGDQQSPVIGDADEQPIRSVTVSPFAASVDEVTVDAFVEMLNWAIDPNSDGDTSDGYVVLDPPAAPRFVLSAAGSRPVLYELYAPGAQISWGLGGFTVVSGGSEPVVNVTWYGALFHCWGLNQRNLLSQPIDRVSWSVSLLDGYRLPTEAEWEYLAHGGVGGNRYPWGNTDPSILATAPANYRNSGDAAEGGGDPELMPVRSYGPTGYGLHDLAGNAAEWCLDWYDRQAYDGPTLDQVGEPAVDPRGPVSGTYRCVRGGSWADDPFYLRNTDRERHDPGRGASTIGFRVVRTGPASNS